MLFVFLSPLLIPLQFLWKTNRIIQMEETKREDQPVYKPGQVVDGKICTGSKVVYQDEEGFVIKYTWKKAYPRSSEKERKRRLKNKCP